MDKEKESFVEHIEVNLISFAYKVGIRQEILSRQPLLVTEWTYFKGLSDFWLRHATPLFC